MATVTGFTAGRMLAMENATVINGAISGDNLMLITKGGQQINAGNVRGPVGPTGFPNPIGTILMGGWTSDPDGYLLLDGRTVANGVSLYPALAAIYTYWVSGSNLVLPNTQGTVPMGGQGVGTISGSMSHALTSVNQLPAHTHTGPSHTHSSDHTHGINSHGHGSSAHGNHYHPTPYSGGDVGGLRRYLVHLQSYVAGEDYFQVWSGGANPGGSTAVQLGLLGAVAAGTGTQLPGDGSHGHSVDPSGSTATLSASSAFTGPSGTGNTGPVGIGAAINHTPKNIQVRYAVKY